jgi:hypothetical protein
MPLDTTGDTRGPLGTRLSLNLGHRATLDRRDGFLDDGQSSIQGFSARVHGSVCLTRRAVISEEL